MNRMEIYEKVRHVPNEAKKPIAAGRLKGMTNIDPMWRIKCLTETFGPCGIGWWYEITDKRILEDEQTKQKAAFVDLNLYFVDPETGAMSHGIPGTGGSSFVAQERNGAYLSDECFKMALTDALSVACKALGVGADVYYGNDRTKYSVDTVDTPPAPQAEPKYKPKSEPKPAPPPATTAQPAMMAKGQFDYIVQIGTEDQIEQLRMKYGEGLERMTRQTAERTIARLKELNHIE